MASCSFCGVAVRSVAVGGGAVVVVSRVPAALPACLLFPAAAVRPSLLARFGSGTFFLFAVINVASLIFVLLCLPETRGKSLEQIEQDLHRRFG